MGGKRAEYRRDDWSPELEAAAAAAVRAAWTGDWRDAIAALAGVDDASVAHLGLICQRLGQRAENEAWQRKMNARRGVIPGRGCGHPVEGMWLIRGYIRCRCGGTFNVGTFVDLAVEVVRFDAKEHCRDWHPDRDPRDRFHALTCTPGGKRVAPYEPPDGLRMPWDPELDQAYRPDLRRRRPTYRPVSSDDLRKAGPGFRARIKPADLDDRKQP